MRTIQYIYELYDKNNKLKGELKDISRGSLSFNSLADIKRTLMIDFRGEVSNINFLNDRLMAKIRIKDLLPIVPSTTEKPAGESIVLPDGSIEYCLGLFLFSSPEKSISNDQNGYSCTCFDLTKILSDTRLENLYYVPAESNVTDEVEALLKGYIGNHYSLVKSAKTTSVDVEFQVGTPILKVINKLLEVINYTSLYTDGLGRITTEPYLNARDKQVRYNYEISDRGIVLNKDITVVDDISSTPNHWIAYTSNSQADPLVAVYENIDPKSPTSIYNRGRRISAEPYEVSDIADKATLEEVVKQLALKDVAARKGKLTMKSLINPVHGFLDHIIFDGISFQQMSWEVELITGGLMKHECRVVV